MTVRVAVFASGGGSNLQSLLDHFNGTASRVARVSLVVSDRAQAGALDRGRRSGVPVRHVPTSERPAREVEAETVALLEDHGIDLIALGGYLRLVPPAVIARWQGRILNIHPALLPAFGGKGMYGIHVHRAVLAAGCLVSGATVHFVTERYDEGLPIVQWPVPVLRGDVPETLAARVLRIEHALYPIAVEMTAAAVSAGTDVRTRLRPLDGTGTWGFAAAAGGFDWHDDDRARDELLRRLVRLDGGEGE